MIILNKELIYENIFDLINNGFFLDKYIELTTKSFDDIMANDFDLSDFFDGQNEQFDNVSTINDNVEETKNIKYLEDTAAGIFNAIIVGCQLFDDKKIIKKFVDMFSNHLDPFYLEQILPEFGISKEDAIKRLNHGFAVHFTTPKIGKAIKEKGKLVGAGINAMFNQEEDKIINYAASEQKKNNPTAEDTLNYLFRGWGTGVSSYGSTTNGFWMYHTPESLTFLYGDISKRNKNDAMSYVAEKISSLDEEDKKIVFATMSNIYDRLIGEEQSTCCILIDRDAFEYEVDYYYETGTPVGVERRPFSVNFISLKSTDLFIKKDIDVSYLKFLKIPTILELERKKTQKLQESGVDLSLQIQNAKPFDQNHSLSSSSHKR